MRRATAMRGAAAMAHAHRRCIFIQGKTATNRRQEPTTMAVNLNFTEHPVFLVKRAAGTKERQAEYCEQNEAGETVFILRAAPLPIPAVRQPTRDSMAVERTAYEYPTAFDWKVMMYLLYL